MRKQWSQVSGFAVIPSEEERPLGYLNGVFMHPETGQLIGFLVGYSRILVPMEIEKWHSDHIKVKGTDSLIPTDEVLRIRNFGLRRTFLNGKRVQSKNGKRLGRVRDFCFETTTSSLLTFEVSKKILWIEWGKRLFSYKDIEEVTEKTIVISAELEEKKAIVEVQVPLTT